MTNVDDPSVRSDTVKARGLDCARLFKCDYSCHAPCVTWLRGTHRDKHAGRSQQWNPSVVSRRVGVNPSAFCNLCDYALLFAFTSFTAFWDESIVGLEKIVKPIYFVLHENLSQLI